MRILLCSVAFVLASITTVVGQSQTKESAPIPTQILTARKIFISNTGTDGLAVPAFQRLGDSNLPYSRFYSEMKNWGKYELVRSPVDSDLVFEIHFGASISSCDKVTSYSPEFELSILDTKTHFVLWRLSAPVEGAVRKSTFEKNFALGMSMLMSNLKDLANQSTSVAASVQK